MCRGAARVRFENPPCYGGQSRRCAEVSLLYAGRSRRRVEVSLLYAKRSHRRAEVSFLSLRRRSRIRGGAISQARGGSLKNYDSSAVDESSCPVCNACFPSARWRARRKVRQPAKRKMAGKTQGAAAGKMQGAGKRRSKESTRRKSTGEQDAGPTIRCTRAQKRLPHAPGYCIIHLSGRLRRRIVTLSRCRAVRLSQNPITIKRRT